MRDAILTQKPTLVYILAASHSGSTLTTFLLNSHPLICTAGELKATNLGNVEKYRCSCKSLISQCEFWKEISKRMEEKGFEFDVRHSDTSLRSIRSRYVQRLLKPLVRGPVLEKVRDWLLHLSPTWRKQAPRWASRNTALIGSVAMQSGANFVVDSSKIAIRLKYLRAAADVKLKVIRVIRDGRGVALAYMNPSSFADAVDPRLRGGGSGDESHAVPSLAMIDAAREWRRSNEEAEQVLKTIPNEDWMCVRYEDICLNTREVMGNIYRFLGIRDDESYRTFRDIEHHIVGNGMRLDDSNNIALDERWRAELSPAHLEEFDRVAGILNRSYGYN